jgi:hypothetical protein
MTIDTRSYQSSRSTVTEMRARQSGKLRELKNALVTSGMLTLDDQAASLGLDRSTTWNILKGNHKSSGLSARIINRILASPRLPPLVRAKILEYVEEKVSGRYGHGISPRLKFIAQLSVKRLARRGKL